MLGVEGDDALAGRAGGGLNAHAVLQRTRDQTVRIGFAQVVLGDEGQLVQVVDALDIVRRYALFFHLLTVVRHVIPHIAHLLNQALVLPCEDLLPAGTFDFRLIIAFHWRFYSFLTRPAGGRIDGSKFSRCDPTGRRGG